LERGSAGVWRERKTKWRERKTKGGKTEVKERLGKEETGKAEKIGECDARLRFAIGTP
jgi:hypothetical protein